MAAAGMHLLHLYDSIGQSSNDICRMMEMAGFVLIELSHGGESIGNTSAVDNRPKWLYCGCKRLKQCHFGVADLVPKLRQLGALLIRRWQVPAVRLGKHSPWDFTIFPIYTAALETRVDPDYVSELLLKQSPHDSQPSRTGSDDNSGASLWGT